MEKIYLVIADSSSEYMEGFKRFIRASSYAERFIIKSFSHQNTLEQFLQSDQKIDILLASPHLIPHQSKKHPYTVIHLIEEQMTANQAYGKGIFKYQPLHQIISQILEIYLENKQEERFFSSNKSKTKIISVYSPVGGSGKTTVCLNLAKQLADQQQNVLYLNLETIASLEVFFPIVGSYDFSKILYYLKANSKQLQSKLEGLKKVDPVNKINYFEPVANLQEMQEMTGEDLRLLLDILLHMEIYQYVVIDLEASLQPRIKSALIHSDDILWLLFDDLQSIHKTNRVFEDFQREGKERADDLKKKVRFVMNKFLGNHPKNDFQQLPLPLTGFLPYIPQWKAVDQKESLFESDVFNRELRKVVQLFVDRNY